MYDKASELYNDSVGIYFHECNEFSNAKRKKLEPEYDPVNLFLETYDSDPQLENEESIDTTKKVINKNL